MASKKAEKSAKETFEGGGLGVDLPEIKINLKEVESGISILDFITDHQILSSKSEARRAIANKGFKINGVLVDNDKKVIKSKDFEKNVMKLSFGKKKHYMIKIN